SNRRVGSWRCGVRCGGNRVFGDWSPCHSHYRHRQSENRLVEDWRSKPAVGNKAAAKKVVAKKTAPRKPAATKRSTKAAKRVVAAKAKKVNEAPEQSVAVGA